LTDSISSQDARTIAINARINVLIFILLLIITAILRNVPEEYQMISWESTCPFQSQ
jgi:hypothetical protein